MDGSAQAQISVSKIAIIVITALALISITLFCSYAAVSIVQKSNQQLENHTATVKTIVADEISKYIYGLQGAKGALVMNDYSYTPLQFRKYAESRGFFSNFSGSLGFGFIRAVKKNELSRYQKNRTEFEVHPQTNSDLNMIVETIEPIEKNKVALGLDISFENNRREAALFAARTGHAAISKKIALIQQNAKHTGFLYLLPAYKSIATPKTEEERMSQLIGWAFAPIILEELIAKIKPKIPTDISFLISVDEQDSVNVSAQNLIKNTNWTYLEIGGQLWKINISTNISEAKNSLISLIIIYLLGIFIIVGLGLYVYIDVAGKDRSLLEKKKWFEAVIGSAGHAVIATDNQGIISIFNTAAEKMLGYTSKETVGVLSPSIFHDQSEVEQRALSLSKELEKYIKPGFDTFVAKALTHGSDTNEWTYIKKNGERIIAKLCVTSILNDQNNVVGYLGIVEDISEHKKLVDIVDMQKINLLESSKLSLLGEMAGGIAHEINTPLATIIGKIELILQKKSDFLEAETQLQKIRDTALRISKIITGLKYFSRNAVQDPPEPTSISEVIDMTLDLCHEKIKHSSVKLNIVRSEDAIVNGRASELSQVLLNLLSNSLDAVSELPEKWIEIQLSSNENDVTVMVTDSGNGISKNVAEKIMNPFYTTKAVGKGTGLGLSVSRGIVQAHDGELFYDLTSKHTRFTICLPKMRSVSTKKSA